MLLSIGLVIGGLVLLVLGGETMLRGAVGLAEKFKLTPAVIGLTVVAAGTSVPELAVSGMASAQGSADIAVANVFGSNIFNFAFILGACAVVRPLALTGNTVKLEYPVLVLVTLLALVICQDKEVNRLDAVLCVAIYVAFMAYLVSLVRGQVTAAEASELGQEVRERSETPATRTGVYLLYVAVGVALLAGGAHLTVMGAVEIARSLDWSERVIGLTIVSAGTGLPEVVASLVSVIRGRTDIAIGNVIGSNLFNVLGVLGITSLVAPLPVSPGLIDSDGWWMLGITLLLFPIMLTGNRIARWEGALLLAVYIGYIWLLLQRPA